MDIEISLTYVRKVTNCLATNSNLPFTISYYVKVICHQCSCMFMYARTYTVA